MGNKIKPVCEHTEGDIDLDGAVMTCVPKAKYSEVTLGLKVDGGIFPFADIKLHDGHHLRAREVFADAVKLGEEVSKRWNASDGEKEGRKDVLLKAAYDILRKCEESPSVGDILGVTAIWDEAECDGYCLMEEISVLLEL